MYFIQLCLYIIPNDSNKVQTREILKLTQGVIIWLPVTTCRVYVMFWHMRFKLGNKTKLSDHK